MKVLGILLPLVKCYTLKRVGFDVAASTKKEKAVQSTETMENLSIEFQMPAKSFAYDTSAYMFPESVFIFYYRTSALRTNNLVTYDISLNVRQIGTTTNENIFTEKITTQSEMIRYVIPTTNQSSTKV